MKFGKSTSLIHASIDILSIHEKRKYLLFVVASSVVSMLDLLGMLISGLSGIYAYANFTESAPPDWITDRISLIGLSEWQPVSLLILFLILMFLCFALKSILSLFLAYLSLYFLRSLSIKYSAKGAEGYFKLDYQRIKEIEREHAAYALTDGTLQIFIGVLGNFLVTLAESFFLFFTIIVLFIIDPRLTLLILLLFVSVFYFTNKKLSNRVLESGERNVKYSLAGKSLIGDFKHLFREISISSIEDKFLRKYISNREFGSKSVVQMQLLQQYPKYLLEFISLVMGIFILLLNTISSDALLSVGKLAIYFAAITRLIPAILRLQTSITGLQSFLGGVELTMGILNLTRSNNPLSNTLSLADQREFLKKINPQLGILIKNLNFTFPDDVSTLLENIDLEIEPNTLVALIGPSGAGKSTLVDLIMGFIPNYSGEILIQGLNPCDFRKIKPGWIGYVPQNIYLVDGTLEENIALGIEGGDVDFEALQYAIAGSMLGDVISGLESGLKTKVGEGGVRFSGGQKQRIVIARALYRKPGLLILDEPTSALDPEIEDDFIKILENLRSTMTLIVISHSRKCAASANQIFAIQEKKVIKVEDLSEEILKYINLDLDNI